MINNETPKKSTKVTIFDISREDDINVKSKPINKITKKIMK